ncbi:uncharacterized protein [Ptychodera flava]|uniref:uncharacterized protein n=1 Tax=Ptychodera flava TaxID=63121 RepID=UPI00396A4AE2
MRISKMVKLVVQQTLVLVLVEIVCCLKLHVSENIVAKKGSTATIQCNIDEVERTESYSSEDLVWYFNGKQLKKKNYTAKNETVSELSLVDIAFNQAGNYTCALVGPLSERVTMVTAAVDVGTPPSVANFSCISHNILDMWCTWDPVESHLPTEYTFTHRPYGKPNQWHPCPHTTAKGENSCYFDEETNPRSKNLMKVTAINQLGESSDEIWFNSDTHTVPHRPENLRVSQVDQTSLDLQWDTPYDWYKDRYFLDYKLQYYSEWEEHDRKTLEQLIVMKQRIRLFDLEPNTLYTFRVKCKLTAIRSAEWSDWSFPATGKTNISAPIQGVRLFVEQEDVNPDNTRDVTVEWRLPSRRLTNGAITGYNVTVVEETNPTDVRKWVIEDGNSTAFKIPKLNRYRSYQVSVIAFNDAGSSPSSSIRILDQVTAPSAPMITKMEATSNSSISVSWKPPENPNGQMVGYVLAYRASDGRMTNQGLWKYIMVDSAVLEYNVSELEEFVQYEFRVQAKNSLGFGGYSQTITRHTLEGVPSGPPVNLTLQAIPEDPSTLVARWEPPDLPDRNGIILAYEIKLCPSATLYTFTAGEHSSAERATCKGRGTTVLNYKVMEPFSLEASVAPVTYTLTKLTANTEYAVSVAAVTVKGVGPASDLVIEKTSFGAPAWRPMDVDIPEELVNWSEFTVRWPLPDETRDQMSHYEVIVRPQNNTKYCQAKFVNTTLTETKIANLCGYEMYEINVRACSVALIAEPCGNYSDPVYATTLMGVPSQPMEVKAVPVDDSTMKVSWLPPERPNGPLGDMMYVIECYTEDDDVISTGKAVGVTDMMMAAECKTGLSTDAVQVTCRVKSSLNEMDSPMVTSNEIQICFKREAWPYVAVVIGSILVVGILLATMACCYKYMYVRKKGFCMEVSHVEPVWETEVPFPNFDEEEKEVFDRMPSKKELAVKRKGSSKRSSLLRWNDSMAAERTNVLLKNSRNTKKKPQAFKKPLRDGDEYISMEMMDDIGAADKTQGRRRPLFSSVDEYQSVSDVHGQNLLLSQQRQQHQLLDGRKTLEDGKQSTLPFACAMGDTENAWITQPSTTRGRANEMNPCELVLSNELHGNCTMMEGYQPLDSRQRISPEDAESVSTIGSSVESIKILSDGSGSNIGDSLTRLLDNSQSNSMEQPKAMENAGFMPLCSNYIPLDSLQSRSHVESDDTFDDTSGSTVLSECTLDCSDNDDEENTVPLLKGIPGHPRADSPSLTLQANGAGDVNFIRDDCLPLSDPRQHRSAENTIPCPSATTSANRRRRDDVPNTASAVNVTPSELPSASWRRFTREKDEKGCQNTVQDYQQLDSKEDDNLLEKDDDFSDTSDSTLQSVDTDNYIDINAFNWTHHAEN